MGDGIKTWRLQNLELGLGEPESHLRMRAAQAVGLAPEKLRGFRIARKSIDARRSRKKNNQRRLHFVVHVDLMLPANFRSPKFSSSVKSGRLVQAPQVGTLEVDNPQNKGPAIVVGSGPAGLYAALVLARNGTEVDLIDRGAPLEERGRDLVRFHRTRVPDPESNLLYGEGGAGTYSDGKLYTRVDDPLEIPCLDFLVSCGAPPEILYDSRAHIGTDRLHKILPKFKERLEALGVRFHWRTKLTALRTKHNVIEAVRTDEGELPCSALFLAPGHSARDTLRALHGQGVRVDPKPFQLGVRIEHHQELINRGRYGESKEAEALGAAYYNLRCKPQDDAPGAYSFCMCPGGKIVGSVNHPGLLCTNGMSNSLHSSRWANAALVTTFTPDDYGPGPFAGVDFQEKIEAAFFEAGGSDYTAPAQRADDFLAGKETENPRHSSYTFGTRPGRIDQLLPERAKKAIEHALLRFERQIPGFAGPDGLLVGVESRSSGPVRLTRDRESLRAEGFDNLYPIGEGAGYAGGIMSAAIDGARAAKCLLEAMKNRCV